MEKRITKTRFNMNKTSIKANNINPTQRTENPIQRTENTYAESMPKDQYWRAKSIDPNDIIYLKACSEAKTINPTQNGREITATTPGRHVGRPRGSLGKEPKKA